MRPRKKQIPTRTKPVVAKKKRRTEIVSSSPEIPVIKAETRKRVKGQVVKVPSSELVNVVADTLERLDFYRGMKDVDQRGSCEQQAQVIVRAIVYGFTETGHTKHGESQVEIREHEYERIPYCKEHKP